jgi:hypothetical protein
MSPTIIVLIVVLIVIVVAVLGICSNGHSKQHENTEDCWNHKPCKFFVIFCHDYDVLADNE